MNNSNQARGLELPKDWQEILMLTMALQQMGGGAGGGGSKRETLRYIERRSWYATCRSDFEQCGNGGDFKFEHSLTRARKEAVEKGFLSGRHHDFWQLLEKGSKLLVRAKQQFTSGTWDVATCYLWGEGLKRLYFPVYEPSDRDWHRTENGFVAMPPVHLGIV